MVCVIALILAVAVAGCQATRPLIPGVSAGPVCTLVFDNQVSASLFGGFLGGIPLEVAIDGFSPTDRRDLPMGQTTLQLPVGSHEMIIKARLVGNARYYFDPIRVSFDTESKSYTITFSKIGTMMKPGYKIQYSGWSTEQSAGWPSEVYIANPLFGGLSPLPEYYLTQHKELAYTILECKGEISHETPQPPAANHAVYPIHDLRLCLNADTPD